MQVESKILLEKKIASLEKKLRVLEDASEIWFFRNFSFDITNNFIRLFLICKQQSTLFLTDHPTFVNKFLKDKQNFACVEDFYKLVSLPRYKSFIEDNCRHIKSYASVINGVESLKAFLNSDPSYLLDQGMRVQQFYFSFYFLCDIAGVINLNMSNLIASFREEYQIPEEYQKPSKYLASSRKTLAEKLVLLRQQLDLGAIIGNEQEGSEQEGSEQEGSEQEGSEQEGSEQEGSEQEGSEQEGSEQEGSEQEGSEQEGSEQEGSEQEGSEQEGSEQEGSESIVNESIDVNNAIPIVNESIDVNKPSNNSFKSQISPFLRKKEFSPNYILFMHRVTLKNTFNIKYVIPPTKSLVSTPIDVNFNIDAQANIGFKNYISSIAPDVD